MAKAFLRSVAEHVFENYKDKADKLCIVLPNKRGALFLKQYLAQSFGQTIWLPQIISAEDFITELSGLKTLEEIDLICHLYESYKTCYGALAESFEGFAKWGQLILQDFNEIDRYLADPSKLYENLKDIKEIENWSLGEENLSEHQQNYLKFMNSLGAIYRHFTDFLLKNNWAYQGLAYRQAVTKLEGTKFGEQFHKIMFVGFNALNAAELQIFNKFYRQKKAEFLWDADHYYLDNEKQEAGLFLRNNFNFFGEKEPCFIENNFSAAKDIRIISVPGQIGQAQVVKQCLQKIIDSGVPPDKIAVVLANEKLLLPVLQQLPPGIAHVNITMEYPLKYTSSYAFIEQILQIQLAFAKQTRKEKTIYHKDLVAFLSQPMFSSYLKAIGVNVRVQSVMEQISSRNYAFATGKNLQQLFGDELKVLEPLLRPCPSAKTLCETILGVLRSCIDFFTEHRPGKWKELELEYLYILFRNFNRLTELLEKYPQFNDLQSFRQLYIQVLGSASAPFIGEPLRGLQIMGVLETRTLDFDHVILVNANEGILPSGKSINSFIPNDLKRAFGLPLYIEKDAIYAYHFYRLLQKAHDVVITYDSETDTFGKGEKSRFVTQLQLELNQFNPGIHVTEEVAISPNFPEKTNKGIRIIKDPASLKTITEKALSSELYGGLSPSGLITFKECALKFYFKYGARLKEIETVEESAEVGTFGSILHLSLENLYKDFEGKILNVPGLKAQLQKVDAAVRQSFAEFFDEAAPKGKSLLQEEVIKVYVKKLLANDLKFIEKLEHEGHHLSLTALEKELTTDTEIELKEKPNTVYLRGKIDRIDTYRGFVRIIDYKSSVKDSDKFVFDGFDPLFNDKNYNKQLQLMLYAWLVYKNDLCPPEKLLPCIIPFKVFLEEPKHILGQDKKPFLFSAPFLGDFESALKIFILGIFNEALPFQQTTDERICEFCEFNVICNIKI